MAIDGSAGGGRMPMDLLERGDPAFVNALRACDDAEVLADFAGRWYDDRRPATRRLLLEYLDRPLNAFRHEALIKRLFKRAEAEGDDEVMARFLVLFDRSIRRVRRKRHHFVHRTVASADEAQAVVALWKDLGYESVGSHGIWRNRSVYGQRVDEVIVLPRRSTMPRGRMVEGRYRNPRTGDRLDAATPDWALLLRLDWHGKLREAELHTLPAVVEKLKGLRLFTLATRGYLRRRAWRYFRDLGKDHPDRYVAAASEALALYRDEDVADGLALIDNWGLVHILFHRSPALVARPGGWAPAPGRSLAELAPSPIFEPLWAASPGSVVGLLGRARCRTVRRWAIRRIEGDPTRALASWPLEGWIGLLGHDDPEVATLAAGVLRTAEGLDAPGVDRWLAVAESTNPVALEVVCDLIAHHVRPEQVTVEQAARLAGLRPMPVARLGFSWLRAIITSTSAVADDRPLLGLVNARCEPLRGEILRWLRYVLEASPETILAFLDSRHADARAEGWAWFQSGSGALDHVETWRRLLESPYDDIRLALVADLESRLVGGEPGAVERALDADDLRRLWASVLLNVHRGSRARPPVVRQLLRRMEARPDEAPALLPILGVALRSVRGPERRAGLVAVVQLVGRRPEVEPLVISSFPELQWA